MKYVFPKTRVQLGNSNVKFVHNGGFGVTFIPKVNNLLSFRVYHINLYFGMAKIRIFYGKNKFFLLKNVI